MAVDVETEVAFFSAADGVATMSFLTLVLVLAGVSGDLFLEFGRFTLLGVALPDPASFAFLVAVAFG